MVIAEVRKQATDTILRKLMAKGYSLDATARRALEAHVTATIKRHAETQEAARPKPETPIEKIARSERVQVDLARAIADYAAEHKVSKSFAADKVLMSPSVSEYHRLDRAVATAQREDTACSAKFARATIGLRNHSSLPAEGLLAPGLSSTPSSDSILSWSDLGALGASFSCSSFSSARRMTSCLPSSG
jgi:hypothetical protein